jgi:hypothetical protein
MHRYSNQSRAGRRLAGIVTAAMIALSACSVDDVLKVDNPDILDPGKLNTPAGAEGLRLGAIAKLNIATSGGESFFMYGGLMADEWRSSDTFTERDETDQRNVQISNANIDGGYRDLHRARIAAEQAIDALRAYAPNADPANIGLMYVIEGYIEVLLAEHFCNGVPMSDVVNGAIVYGTPLTGATIYQRAIAHADSALQFTAGDDQLRVQYGAKLVKGRALVDLGQFAQAATAVTGVPTNWTYQMEHDQTATSNALYRLNISERRYTVADRDGGNGLNFATAGDPRVPVGPRVAKGGFDSNTDLFRQNIWTAFESPATIMTGVEARLIEAEAQLQAGSTTQWLATLNTLRTTVNGLAALTDPGTAAARVDLQFRERAFWLFSTGHRLGDLRRLIRQYTRSASNVFPTGAFPKGGSYGPDVNFPVTQAEENNPNFTACLDRNP